MLYSNIWQLPFDSACRKKPRETKQNKGKLIKPLFTIEIELPMLLSAKANPVKKTNNHDGLSFVRVMTLSDDILRAIFIDSYTKRTMKPPSARES